MAEIFFATLGTELVHRRFWLTRHESEMQVLCSLDGNDNVRRRHSRLGTLSVADYQQRLAQEEASA